MTLPLLKDRLSENGFGDSIILENPDYITAVVGVSQDGQVIYDYEKMVDYLIDNEGMNTIDAIEFIDYNTVRALDYMGEKHPLILYQL